MRVVRGSGSTADVVGLGEDLQLRIEIDQDSAFGLFARNLEARTDNGELLNLIDGTGCPLNELIFPALDLERETRALNADFTAFRFPSTPTVNFVATVQFCQDACDPVDCSGELSSFGKRRRRDLSSINTTATIGPSNLLPEQLMLGLRLTVGENQVAKPRPPSKLGRGDFPEAGPHHGGGPQHGPGYYPARAQLDLGDPSYICSPQATVIALVILLVSLNTGAAAGFCFFYRLKRKQWTGKILTNGTGPPPLPPHNPRPALHPGQQVLFKSGAYSRTRLPSISSQTP